MHFPLVDALAPPPCASQRAQRGINSGVNFANFAKIQYICSCPLQCAPNCPTCQVDVSPKCKLQRRVPPILPHIKFEKVALSSSPNIVLLAKAQRGINSGGEGVAWAASRNLQRIPREGSQILCLFRLRLCPTKNVRRGAQKYKFVEN